jgi:hypothetical protein
MTLLHLHPNDLRGLAGNTRFVVARARRRLGAVLKSIHRAIVKAKLRRLRHELMLQRGLDAYYAPERDASKYPRRPLILGDKWDF